MCGGTDTTAAILDPLIEIYLLNAILISIRLVNALSLLLHQNFGITYRRILNLQTQLMILNANLKQFFLCELMNRDVFIFYLLCTFIYFVVSV